MSLLQMAFCMLPGYILFLCLGTFGWLWSVGGGGGGGTHPPPPPHAPPYYGGIFSKIITGIFENLIILKMHATDKTIFKIPLKINLKL